MRYITTVEERTFAIEVREGEIIIDGETHTVDMRRIEPLALYSLLVDNLSHETFIEERDEKYNVMLRGKLYTVQVQEEHTRKHAVPRLTPPTTKSEILIKAPMPGMVVQVLVTTGQAVRAGEALLILESMKMENNLCASRDGAVKAVHVAAHDQVDRGQVLLTLSTG